MAVHDTEHIRRVTDFQKDLGGMDPIRVIRKHITTGESAVLPEGTDHSLRTRVADHFNIHPSAVVIVGSGRTGFSLKPAKRYHPFGMDSDVDVAVISKQKFDEYWDLVYTHLRTNRLWSRTNCYKTFLVELFKGWLWPRRLPPAPHFQEAKAWAEFEDQLGRETFGGVRSVGARLYRDWDRLEAYQSIHVLECRQALQRGTR